MKKLCLSKERQAIYYNSYSSNNSKLTKKLTNFINKTNEIKIKQNNLKQNKLKYLKLIRKRIELKLIFHSWYLYYKCKENSRKFLLYLNLKKWKRNYLLKKYSKLLLVSYKLSYKVKYYYMKWKENIKIIKIILYYKKKLIFKYFNLFKKYYSYLLQNILNNYFNKWKLYLLLLKKLKKLEYIYQLLPRISFLKWKKLTFDPYLINISEVLNRMNQRTKEEIFYYLLNLSEKLKHERLLSSLPIHIPANITESQQEIVESIIEPSPQKIMKKPRKAPLDNRRTACRCV